MRVLVEQSFKKCIRLMKKTKYTNKCILQNNVRHFKVRHVKKKKLLKRRNKPKNEQKITFLIETI